MPSPLDSEQSVFKGWWAKCECNGELRFVRVVASAAFQEPIPCIWADHEVGEAPREASSANGKKTLRSHKSFGCIAPLFEVELRSRATTSGVVPGAIIDSFCVGADSIAHHPGEIIILYRSNSSRFPQFQIGTNLWALFKLIYGVIIYDIMYNIWYNVTTDALPPAIWKRTILKTDSELQVQKPNSRFQIHFPNSKCIIPASKFQRYFFCCQKSSPWRHMLSNRLGMQIHGMIILQAWCSLVAGIRLLYWASGLANHLFIGGWPLKHLLGYDSLRVVIVVWG
jgi:hypothetical protein